MIPLPVGKNSRHRVCRKRPGLKYLNYLRFDSYLRYRSHFHHFPAVQRLQHQFRYETGKRAELPVIDTD